MIRFNAGLFTRPLVANTADMIATSSNGAAVSGPAISLLPMPMPIDGVRPIRPLERVSVQGQNVHGTDKAEIFTVLPKDGQAPSGSLGVIINYGKNDGLDLSRLGRFQVLETTKVDNVYEGQLIRIAPLEGRKLSLDFNADGKADAHLYVAGDGFLPTAIKDLPVRLPGGAVGSPIQLDPGVRPLPVEPPGGWRTNMPMLPGNPNQGVVRPIEGELTPVTVPGSPGDGQFQILPYPMPDTAPGEATILPFPLPAVPMPGQPVSFASWGSWIGL